MAVSPLVMAMMMMMVSIVESNPALIDLILILAIAGKLVAYGKRRAVSNE